MTMFTSIAILALFVLLMFGVNNLLSNALAQLLVLTRVPYNRYVDWACGGLLAVATPAVAFALLAIGTAAIVPPPQEFTYATMEINPEATFWQRNVAYIALATGYTDVEVRPGRIYSRATVKISDTEAQTFIGLPGAGKWYKL